MLPLAPQRSLPSVHDVAHATQLLFEQTSDGPHVVVVFHTEQLFTSVAQVSTPFPLHRFVPTVQVVPHMPQAPPEQKVVHCCEVLHEVQPLGSATQVSTVFPLQRLVPAVHAVLQAVQLPF
jgi:hypothetical protein